MDAALIEHERQRRAALCHAFSLYISQNFQFDTKGKLRRGTVQKEIADYFDITINTTFCQLVNECMEAQGFKRTEIRGSYYYKNIRPRT